jgi:hypothetical protein
MYFLPLRSFRVKDFSSHLSRSLIALKIYESVRVWPFFRMTGQVRCNPKIMYIYDWNM